MKITVNYISNVFLAVILAVIPYTALIKLFIKNNDTPFLNVEMVLIIILNIIVYISAVTGLETAENKAKEYAKAEKATLEHPYGAACNIKIYYRHDDCCNTRINTL